jgi:hypothetical protein
MARRAPTVINLRPNDLELGEVDAQYFGRLSKVVIVRPHDGAYFRG